MNVELHYFVPFVVGYVPAMSYAMYLIYELVFGELRGESKIDESDVEYVVRRLKKVHWVNVIIYPLAIGIAVQAAWWLIYLGMSVVA